jgi:hypothetical protein
MRFYVSRLDIEPEEEKNVPGGLFWVLNNTGDHDPEGPFETEAEAQQEADRLNCFFEVPPTTLLH